MSTDAASKATPVAAPAKPAAQAAPAKPAAAPAAASPAAPKPSPEQLHQAQRMDRIKTAVADAKKKSEESAAKAAEATPPAEGSEPVKKVEDKATPDKPAVVEPPTVIKTEKKEEKPVVPAAEEDPIDKWKLADNANAETVKNFKEIREEAKARKLREQAALTEVAQLKTQLETYRNANPADVAATEQLKTQLKEAHDRLAIFDLKSHPDFVRQYVEPISGALAEAREVITYNTKEGDAIPDLGALLSKAPKEFNAEVAKLTKDMNQVDSSIVINALRQAHKLNTKQGEVLSKSGELQAQLQQKSAQQAKAAFEEVSKNLGPSNDFLQPLEIVDGLSAEDKTAAENYNASLASVRTNAEKLAFGRIDERGVAQMSYKAATLDHMLQHTIPRVQAEFKKLAHMVAEQNEVIKQLRGGKGPDVAGGGGGETKVDLSKMSVEERVKYRLAEARAAKQR
jgi:hypothetical protein